MREITKTIRARILSYGELDLEARILMDMARDARKTSQCPYSGYAVGAAVAVASHMVTTGCNVERAHYIVTHAEQHAIDDAVKRHGAGARIRALGLVGAPKGTEIVFSNAVDESRAIMTMDEMIAPCGHCLQCIWENCHGDASVRLIARCPNGEFAETTIGDAFPMRFGPLTLGVDYAKR
jgi:cytidine deaminase